MKRGSSVLQPPSEAAKRHTHDACSLSVPSAHAQCTPDAAGSSPFPSATSLFSPDVSTKMASDLLIRLSEATQKAQMHPGSRAEAEQQDEPGLALSPDGPGASPEPPSLTNTPDGNNSTDTLASDLLRKLAERQDVHGHVVRLKEEEEPMEVDAVAQNRPITEVHCGAKMVDQRLHGGSKMADNSVSGGSKFQLRVKVEDHGMPGAKMADQRLHGGSKMADDSVSGGSKFQLRVKVEDQERSGAKMEDHVLTGAKMEDHRMSGAKMEYHVLTGAKMEDHVLTGAKMEDHRMSGAKMEYHVLTGAKMEDHVLTGAKMEDGLLFKTGVAERSISGAQMSNGFVCGIKMEDEFPSGAKMENQLVSGTKMEEQLFFGAKMEEPCLRAVLWQDMSVNLASTLLHQLSERVSKSSSQLTDRMTPPTRSSPVLKVDQLCSPQSNLQDPLQETQTSRDQTTGCSYFYRCHVCGFETDGHALFQSHMTEHRQWEHGSFSLHCCVCDLSTNQEAEMRAHVDTHFQGDTGDIRCPVALPATSCSAPVVAMVTPPQQSSLEHRCRICQRSFPGQQELLVHFQGHRQGNQYRCDRCGHLTRTANKLVEHVRVHTGERPFTCTLCPYSAKRRDSLRLHCKVKHAAHAADAPADVHTHRSYVHGDNQRANKQVQRLHTPPSALSAAAASCRPPLHPSLTERAGWRDLSPLLPISTLLTLKPRSASSSSSSTSASSSSSSLSNKLSFLGYLGLTASL